MSMITPEAISDKYSLYNDRKETLNTDTEQGKRHLKKLNKFIFTAEYWDH